MTAKRRAFVILEPSDEGKYSMQHNGSIQFRGRFVGLFLLVFALLASASAAWAGTPTIDPTWVDGKLYLARSTGTVAADEERVWAALEQGGMVIMLRHTHVDIREGIGKLDPGNCAAEVNLSPRGIEQAKSLGAAFHAHGIAVGDVLSSPYCRCLDTGILAFGHATVVRYLEPPGIVSDNQAAANTERVMQEIRNHRGPSNLVMITHDLNIANIVLEPADMGTFFVLKPNQADFTFIGKIDRYAH